MAAYFRELCDNTWTPKWRCTTGAWIECGCGTLWAKAF